MKISLQQALDNTETTYSQLKEIADDMFATWSADIKQLVKQAEDVNSLTNDKLRELIFKLAIKSFNFSEIKERAAIKANIAESLRKEAYANEYSKAEGAVAARDTVATAAISNEILVETVYELVASLFKVTLDETHRLIDSLKTILTTRLSEAKLTSNIPDTI